MAHKMVVTGGPSKLDLMLDFFDSNNRKSKGHEFKFHSMLGGEKPDSAGLHIFLNYTKKKMLQFSTITITSLKKEDGECENFGFTGWAWASEKIRVFVEGKYNTHERMGSLCITKTIDEDGCEIK